jgi:CBS domain containing-hemolysin-like protein
MYVSIIVAVLLLAFTGYLAAAETLVTRLDVVRAMRLKEEEARGGAALLWLTEHRATALSVLLVATVIARVALAGIAVLVGYQEFGGAVGAVLAAVLVVLASLVLAEIVPRTLVARSVERAGGYLGGLTRGLVLALRVPAALVVGSGKALVPRRAGGAEGANGDADHAEIDEDEHDEPRVAPAMAVLDDVDQRLPVAEPLDVARQRANRVHSCLCRPRSVRTSGSGPPLTCDDRLR